jgi:hypothetical protein
MFTANKNSTKVSDEQAMHDVMAMLDDWKAPEPSAWFDARMMARFREEQAKEPEGFFARLRDRWLFNTSATMKPLMVGSLAVAMIAAGGGSYIQFASHMDPAPQPAAISATVQDLQILDNNAQAIQQMNQLLGDDGDTSPQS